MSHVKRAALFCKSTDEKDSAYKLQMMQSYANNNNMVITMSFSNETDMANEFGEYDVILSCGEQILLPIAGIEIIDVSL